MGEERSINDKGSEGMIMIRERLGRESLIRQGGYMTKAIEN